MVLLSEPIKAKDGSGDLAQLVQGMGGVVSVQEEQGKRVGEAATARARTRKKKKGGGDKPARYNSDHRPGDWIGVSLLNCTAHLHESFAVTLKDRWRITIQPFQDADKHMQCPASHLRSPGDAEEGAHACVFVGEW